MPTNLNTIMRDVHANSVAHGWWEDGRNDDQILCLIHSEWSEALEEERAGRPIVWLACENGLEDNEFCMPLLCHSRTLEDSLDCPHRGKKPEGFAVELIDGCIRILDYMGYITKGQPAFRSNVDNIEKLCDPDVVSDVLGEVYVDDIFGLVRVLHALTAMVTPETGTGPLFRCLVLCFNWIKNAGLDPEDVLLTKHEYNKTRPYKHGKKF